MADRTQFGLSAIDTVPLHEKVSIWSLCGPLMSGQSRGPARKLTSRKARQELGTATCRCAAPFMATAALRRA